MTREQEIIDEARRHTAKGWKDPDVVEAYIAGYLSALRYVQRHVTSHNPREVFSVRQLLDALRVSTCARCGSIQHHVSDCDG